MIIQQQALPLLDLLRSGTDGLAFLANSLQGNELPAETDEILSTIHDLCLHVHAAVDAWDLGPHIHRVGDIVKNIEYYIHQLQQKANLDFAGFAYDFDFHLCSLYRTLCYEIAYILENHVDHSAYPEFYPETVPVDHQHIRALGENSPCLVSVVLLAYNKLSYTRQCVESILKYTSDVDYELILVDNGSTDETLEYFRSIPGAKVIHLPHNLGVVKGFNIGMMAAEGRYTATVCNDFIFTHRWLKNLVTCIESDEQYGYVSPGATNISNLQQIDYTYVTESAFHAFADTYNHSNPRKWEERVVLLPNVLFCRTALLSHIGYYDTRFYHGEFGDDDISFRIRRAGYKLVYCKDTITHHFGSITTSADHIQNNSLERGRRQFFEKYGIDSWVDARPNLMHYGVDLAPMKEVRSILGIHSGCGATLMQIKNKIYEMHGTMPQISSFVTDEKYQTDLKTICDAVYLGKSNDDLFNQATSTYDLVTLETPLDELSEDPQYWIRLLKQLVSPTGFVALLVNNACSSKRIMQLLSSNATYHGTRNLDIQTIARLAIHHGFSNVQITNLSLFASDEERKEHALLAKFMQKNYPLPAASKEQYSDLLAPIGYVLTLRS